MTDQPTTGTPPLDLDAFCRLAPAVQETWTEAGAVASVERSPRDGRTKASAWLSIDAGVLGGSLAVWDSGEGDLEVWRDDLQPVLLRHLDAVAEGDLPDLLAELEQTLVGPDS